MATFPTSSTWAMSWWALIIRGIAGIVFGVLAFIWPGLTVTVLVLLFGAYALVDGIFAIVAAIRGQGHGHTLWLILEGIVGIIAGLIAFFATAAAALALLFVIAAWALITGVLEVIAAIRLRDVIANDWSLLLAGIASVIFGILLFVWPAAGILTVVWLIAAYAIIFGILMLVLAFRFRAATR